MKAGETDSGKNMLLCNDRYRKYWYIYERNGKTGTDRGRTDTQIVVL